MRRVRCSICCWFLLLFLYYFFSWFILTVFWIYMWNQSGQCSIQCRYADGILWPSPGWRHGSTSSGVSRGRGVDGAWVTAREARRGAQGALLFETDIYILQNYLSEGKWNLVNVVWDTKQRDESSRDVQKDKFLCGPERLSCVLSYWAMTSHRPEKFPVSQGRLCYPLYLQDRTQSVISKSWLCKSHLLPSSIT